jgi:hypothetical protein
MQSAYALSNPENQDRPKSWRDVLPVHPACDLFPLMTKDELRELANDIKKNDLHEPVVLYDDPKIGCCVLDGRNRLDALELFGWKITNNDLIDPVDEHFERVGSPDPSFDPVAYVISKNIRRRHLTVEQKRELIGKLLKADPEKSNRQIAKTTGVDHKTVAVERRKKESTGEIPQLKKTKGKDGKSRPVRQKRATEKVKRSLNGSAPTPDMGKNSSKPTTSKPDVFAASAGALSEFKHACDHWLPKMVPEHRSEAVKFFLQSGSGE